MNCKGGPEEYLLSCIPLAQFPFYVLILHSEKLKNLKVPSQTSLNVEKYFYIENFLLLLRIRTRTQNIWKTLILGVLYIHRWMQAVGSYCRSYPKSRKHALSEKSVGTLPVEDVSSIQMAPMTITYTFD